MTPRQFSRRWSLWVVFSAVAIAACVVLLAAKRSQTTGSSNPTSGLTDSTQTDSTQEDFTQADSTQRDGLRILKVIASRIGASGPEYLVQRFTGVVVARRTSRLAAKALGRVESVAVDLGDAVQAGQLLVQLDHAQLDAQRHVAVASMESATSRLQELQNGPRRQDIEQAEARVNELQANVRLSQANADRTRSLRDSSAISTQEYDESRFRLQATVAQLASAEKALDLLHEGTRPEQLVSQSALVGGLRAQLATIDVQLAEQRITAPYDGHIRSRQTDEGDVVSPGQTLLEIAETAVLEVHVGLPTRIARELEPSNFRIAIDDRQLVADLDRMAPVVDESTRTRKCVFRLRESATGIVVIGDAVSIEIHQPVQTEGVWIPTTALTAGARGLWIVFIAEPTGSDPTRSAGTHLIEGRPVELLRAQGAWSEVRGLLDASELLVTAGVHRIVSGQYVELASHE